VFETLHAWRARVALLLALLALVGTAPARAQDAGSGAEPAAPAVEPAAAGPRLADLEKELVQLRARLEEWAARSAEYEQARKDAPALLGAIEREIAKLERRDALAISAHASRAELQAELLSQEQDLALARQDVAELDAEVARRAERRKKIPELLAAGKERLSKLGTPPAPVAAATPDVLAALEQLGKLRRAALEAEIQAYQNELASYDARGQLLAKRRDRAALRVAYHEARLAKLRDVSKEEQQLAAEREARAALEALAEAATLPPAVRGIVEQLAEQNAELARLRSGDQGLVEKIDDVSRKLARAEEQVAEVEAGFANLAEKIGAAGLSDSVGLLLRRQRSEAPEVGKYERFIRMRRDLIGSVQLQQIELREQRRGLADAEQLVERLMAEIDEPVALADERRVQALLRQLFETRRRYLDALLGDYETYFQKLVDFDAKQQELIDRTERLLGFIDERILWIPSSASLGPQVLSDGIAALGWLMTPRFWGQLGRALRDAATSTPLLNLAVVALLLLSLPLARRIPPRLRELGDQARSSSCTRYAPTWEALGLTLLLLPWLPGLLAYLGWRLSVSAEATQFTRSIAHGMLAAAVVWITLRLPRQIARTQGLAESHFGWPASAAKGLRRHLDWLTPLAVLGVLLIYVFEMRGEDAWKESIGRLVFLVLMLATAAFTHLLLRERGGALAAVLHSGAGLRQRPWAWRLAHAAAVAAPLLLAAAALRGYYWTALQLASRQHAMLVFLFLLLVAVRLSVRWSLLTGRRVALEQARQRAAELREPQGPSEPLAASPEPSEAPVDLAAIEAKTGRLVSSTALFAALLGLWVIWADVLPAAGILREVELWNTTQAVAVEVTDASGVARLTTERQVVPVTLANLVFALLIGLVAVALVRNLPGLLEVSLLRRLGAGERYAYASLVQYGVTLVGIALAFDAVGVGWSNIQWLVAAVGLGLGFGLQEIFANFVSGLIILFERPIRVGDTVTVGDLSGTVTRIRIRATWITSFDRKELVVPNKEFVTARLVNWSLSDTVLRVDIPVGIAYGSNTESALEVLRRVAEENEHVLESPPPQALFLGFGDSALSFELRAFSPDVTHLVPIRHELHMAIDRAFREAGIEIAFPQRDLHVRSLPPGWQPPSSPGPAGGPA
jgi:potassium efflux system protein